MFGPITGNGKNITFSTCFSGNAVWDSYFELYEAASASSPDYCGGSTRTTDWNDNASSTCQFGSELSTLTRTLTTGLTYWLP
ncbi:hypothetical protein HaLaN_24085, partial [Haematococcus lacustris]